MFVLRSIKVYDNHDFLDLIINIVEKNKNKNRINDSLDGEMVPDLKILVGLVKARRRSDFETASYHLCHFFFISNKIFKSMSLNDSVKITTTIFIHL